MNKLTLTLFFLIAFFYVQGQDTLPKFSVRNVGNKRIIIEWFNKFENTTQISIQRSFDSLKNFKTILTVPDPSNPQNGFADLKADNDRMYYRLYILLGGGTFFFSPTKRPAIDTGITTAAATEKRNGIIPGKPNTIVPAIPIDSINRNSGLSSSKPKLEAWTPSKFVFTNNDGYIRISLPNDPDKSYRIKFFTNDDKPLFELKDIKERSFKLDKSDFYRSGWFKFELYEDEILKEKNRFFLPKEF